MQRKTLLKDAMVRGEPFARLVPGLQRAIETGLTKLEVFKTILQDFDRMFVVDRLPDSKRDVLKGQIKEFVCHARAKVIATEYAIATNCE